MRDLRRQFYAHPWAWNEIGFGGPAYPRGYARFGSPHLAAASARRGRARRRSTRDPVETRGSGGSSEAQELRQGLRAHAGGQRLAVPARHAQARPAEPRPDGALPATADRSTCVVVGAGAGGRHARAAARARGLADRDPREGPVLGSRPRLGLATRRAPARSTGRTTRIIAGNDPIEMGKNNSGVGVGGSMTHFAGYVPRLPSVRLRGAHARRRRRRLADLVLGPEGVVRAGRARAAGRRAGLAVGRPAQLSARRRTRSPARRSVAWRGRARLRHRDARRPGRRSRTASSATGRTASTAASACRAAR